MAAESNRMQLPPLESNLVPISAEKFEPMLVCSSQHKNRIPSTSALAELHPAPKTTEIFPSSEISAKEKTNRKKTKRKLLKQEALRKKRKSENKRVVEYERIGSISRYIALAKSVSDMETFPIICPPYDLAATTLEAAYPLQKIIYDDEWDHLLDVLELSNAGEKVSFDVYPVFVCNRVHKLDDIKDEKEKRKLAGILSFITHLVRFDRFYNGGVDRIPGKLLKRFSSLFTQKLGQYRLIVLYILVLTLHADNFNTNLKDISVDLRCRKELTKDNYRCLGCEVVEDEKITLSLPLQLQFPESVSMVEEADESRVSED